jgi:TonB-dependent starch-binding outer membrane protein SusC
MRKFASMLLLAMLISAPAWAQRSISGKVTDEKGNGIPNASIAVRGSTVGTVTQVDGSYTLNLPANARNLVFSALGFVTNQQAVGAGNVLNVSLKTEDRLLQEVVVTGTGTATSRKKVAFAVESLSEKDIPKVPAGSIDRALVGRIAGAQISSTSGQPGQQANIILRGINSLGSTQPMIMVDGIQVNAGGNNNGSGVNVSSRLSDIDLNNVEKVEVIQGAAAATIYGAQGANGVIQIFTKRGKSGKTKIGFNNSISFEQALTGNLKLAQNHFYNTNAGGFITNSAGNPLTKDAFGTWQIPVSVVSATAQNNKPYLEPVYDNIGAGLNSAVTRNHNLNITGGRDKFDFAFNVSHLNQESVIFGEYERSNVTANLGFELFKNFKMRSITQLIYSENNTGGITGSNNVNSALGNFINAPRYVNLQERLANGTFASNPNGTNSVNPYYDFANRTYANSLTRIIQNVQFNYKPIKYLELDYKLGLDNYRYDYSSFTANQTALLGTSGLAGINPITGRIANDRDNETFTNSLFSAFVRTDFEKDFGWNIPIQTQTQFSFDWRKRNYRNEFASGTGFPAFPPFNLSTAQQKNATEFRELFRTYGYLINQKIDFANYGGVSAGFRVDKASTFGEGNASFFFPRGDVYFRASELFKSDIIKEWKLRGAYGEAGIQPGVWERQVTLNTGNIGQTGVIFNPTTVSNPQLEVQVSKETEVGTDLVLANPRSSSKFFKRISLSASYWSRKSENAIRAIDVAISSGSGALLTNALTMESSGFQFSLDAGVYESRNFAWDFGIRFGTAKTIVNKISNGKDIVVGGSGSGQFVIKEGERVGAFFGVKPLTAVDQKDAAGAFIIPSASHGDHEVVNGYVVNKNTKVVVFNPTQEFLGDPTPKFNMTFLNTFTIMKDLSVFMQWDWVYGQKIYNQTRQWLYRDFIHGDFDQPLTINGQTGPWVAYYNSLYRTNANNSHFVEDGSFLRLRDVTVTYNVKNHIAKKLNWLEACQVFVSGRNLATITNYTGMDPEAAAQFNNPLNRGLDLYAFPNSRQIQVGLNLGF